MGIPPTWGLLSIPKASAGGLAALGEGSVARGGLCSQGLGGNGLPACARGGVSWILGKKFRGRVVKHWNRMSRAVVDGATSPGVFREPVGLWVGAGLRVGLGGLRGLVQPQGF